MEFWTKEEYLKFSEAMMDKPLSYYAFELLYWCGVREGELLALSPSDFNFEKRTLRINKSYQRLEGEDVISTPKTKNSNRIVKMPQFLCNEMQDFFKQYYSLQPDDRIFPVTKYYLSHEMDRGCKESGVKRIRVHDLRHPYDLPYNLNVHSLRHPYVKLTTKNKLAAKAEIPNYQHEFDSLRFLLFCLDVQVAHDKQKPYSSNVTYVS